MNKKPKILFVCSTRGARALIAATFAEHLGEGRVESESASFEGGRLGPLPRKIMEERGLPIPTECAKTVFERHRDGERYDHVVTLCQQSRWSQCPNFQTNIDGLYARASARHSWSIQDFAGLEGSEDERRAAANHICDQIRGDVMQFLPELLERGADS